MTNLDKIGGWWMVLFIVDHIRVCWNPPIVSPSAKGKQQNTDMGGSSVTITGRIQNWAKRMCDIGAMWTMRPCRGPTSCRPSLCSASRPIVVAHGSRTMATKGCISSSSYQRDAKQTGLAPRHAHPGLLSEARHQRWAAPLRCQKVDSSVLVRI